MAVVNLGTMTYRPSVMSGLSEALQSGIESGQKQRDVRTKESLLSAQLAEYKSKETEKNREHAHKIHKKLSLKYVTANPEDKKNFFEQDYVKESTKIIQKYLPEFYNKDKKQFEPLALEWFPKTEQEKKKFERESKEAAQKIKSNAPLSVSNLVALQRAAQMGAYDALDAEEEATWRKRILMYDKMIQKKIAQQGADNMLSDSLRPGGAPGAGDGMESALSEIFPGR